MPSYYPTRDSYYYQRNPAIVNGGVAPIGGVNTRHSVLQQQHHHQSHAPQVVHNTVIKEIHQQGGTSSLPPGFVVVQSHSRPGHVSYYDPIQGQKYSTLEMAWDAYSSREEQGGAPSPPPGYVKVSSHTRPGEYSYYCTATDKRYGTLQLAWAAYKLDNNKKAVIATPATTHHHHYHHQQQQQPSIQSPPTAAAAPASSSPLHRKVNHAAAAAEGGYKGSKGSRKIRHTGGVCDHGRRRRQSWQLMEIDRHERWSIRARLRRWMNKRKIRRHTERHMWWRTMKASQNTMDAPPPDKVPRPGMDGLFIDKEFSPLDSRNTIGPVNSEDPKSRLRLTPKERDEAVWVRIPDLIRMNCGLSHDEEVNLFDDTIEPNDLTQGVVGDCWLLASMACLAEFPDSVVERINPKVISPIGKYTVSLYDHTKCRWEDITIDDYVPCKYYTDYSQVPYRINEQGKRVYDGRVKPRMRYKPLFAAPHGNEMWCLILEKAMAKFVGSYSKIAGGHEPFAFMTMTGYSQVYEFKRKALDKDMTRAEVGVWQRGWAQWHSRDRPTCGYKPVQPGMADKGGILSTQYNNDALFDKLLSYDERNYLLAACITCFQQPKSLQGYFRPDGLVLGHAYSLISACRVGSIRLVQLRNPHGKGEGNQSTEWNGRWSDGDLATWRSHPEVVEATGFAPGDDGMFWMSFDDFASIFDKVMVLAMSMSQPRAALAHSRRGRKSSCLPCFSRSMGDAPDMSSAFMKVEGDRLSLGVAMKAILHDEEDGMQQRRNLLAYRQMSMCPYDPYLNAPEWIKENQSVWKKWLDEKGIQYK